MQTEQMFVIWSCLRIKGGIPKRVNLVSQHHSTFSLDRSKAVLRFHVSVVLHLVFVLSLFVLLITFYVCLWKDQFRNCGISWVSSLIFAMYSYPHNDYLILSPLSFLCALFHLLIWTCPLLQIAMSVKTKTKKKKKKKKNE